MKPTETTRNPSTVAPPRATGVVGIGASAGGLEALQKFLNHLPSDTGLAYVVIQHRAPDFPSQLEDLLSQDSAIPVQRATDGLPVQPDTVYLLPPRKEMTISQGRLRLADLAAGPAGAQPIDTFFQSLAHDAGDRAVAVILSGTGCDGARGSRAVRDAGGLVIVQDPATAKYGGMPQSALAAGAVDGTLAPEAMPAVILARTAASAREALQAACRELEGTRRALQAAQEELAAARSRHRQEIAELTHVANDMDHLLQSTDMETVFLDRHLRIRRFTPSITQTFRIGPQDLGRRIDDIPTSIQYEQLIPDLQRVLRSAPPIERQVHDRQGHWYLLRILPYRLDETITGAVITLTDIDSVKATQRELNLMSKVFMDGAAPIIIEDLDGRVRYVNDEAVRVYGWSRDELVGNRVELLMPDSQRHWSDEFRRRCRQGEPVRNIETVRRTKAGALQPILLTLSLLTDEAGRPLAIASIAEDITDRKQAELQCREAVERRDQFLAILSHELRNPLGAIINATYLLEQNCFRQDSCHRPCAVIVRQAHLMARLLDDLLDVSRVMQGKIDIRREPCDLRKPAEAALEVVRPQIEGRDQKLVVDIEPAPLTVNGDFARLQQIQVNLLHNAMKYTPAGGTIRLTLRHEQGDVVIRVRDTGEGIPVELLQSVFDLFVQAGGTLDRSEGGMGIGLTLVHQLVTLHGGTVSAYSAGPGTGSEFVVRLPACAPQPTSSTATRLPPPPVDFRRILIVEDNADSREMLRSLLEIHGYDVEAAENGRVGLSMLEQKPFDMALVDIGLPGIDGYEVARRIRRDPRHRTLRLVALTGYGRTADREAVRAAGFDEHFVKPLDPDNLTRLLARREDERSSSG